MYRVVGSTNGGIVAGLAVILSLIACDSGDGIGRDDLSAGWPEWQRIEVGAPPTAWRLEQASFAFDAWEATAVVTSLTTTDEATTIRFDDEDGEVLDVRLAALPSGAAGPALSARDSVRVNLIRRQGFEGVARGLVVTDRDRRLLLAYDDGGYGSAIPEDGARGGVAVERSLQGTDSGGGWRTPDVTFRIDGASFVASEGETVPLGASGLAATVVVSREWTGAPVTDVDVSPLAYLIFRVGPG